MANIFSRIGSKIKATYKAIKGLLIDPDTYESVLDTVDAIAALAKYAYPAAKLVAEMTPTSIDNKVLEALGKLGLTISDIFDEADEVVRHGRLLQLAATVARRELKDALSAVKELRIGKFVITAVDVITNDALRAAVSLAYTALVRGKAVSQG